MLARAAPLVMLLALICKYVDETDQALGWLKEAVAAGLPGFMIRDSPDVEKVETAIRA